MAIDFDTMDSSVVPELKRKASVNTNAKDGKKQNLRSHSPAQKTDKVSITPSAVKLQAVEQKLATVPVVDQSRVDKVRSALERGEYQFDAKRVAEKFILFETELHK